MNEPWDEDDWERFFQEADRRTERYIEAMESFVRRYPPPDERDPGYAAWKERLHQHLARRMGWDPRRHGPEWLEDPFDLGPEDEPPDPEDAEPWKRALPEAFPEAQPLEALPVFQAAQALCDTVLDWADTLPGSVKDGQVVELCAAVMHVATKLAGGHGMGYEPEALGGNIAYAKRALAAANRALAALTDLRGAAFLPQPEYHRLSEAVFEVRNGVGLHVQRLRERFLRGGAPGGATPAA